MSTGEKNKGDKSNKHDKQSQLSTNEHKLQNVDIYLWKAVILFSVDRTW